MKQITYGIIKTLNIQIMFCQKWIKLQLPCIIVFLHAPRAHYLEDNHLQTYLHKPPKFLLPLRNYQMKTVKITEEKTLLRKTKNEKRGCELVGGVIITNIQSLLNTTNKQTTLKI